MSATLRGLAIFAIFGTALYAYASVTYPVSQPNPVSGVVGLYVGATDGTTDGDIGGYDAAASDCTSKFPDSHICTPMEIINTYNHNLSAVSGVSGAVWLNSGAPANTTPAVNDCQGWTKGAGEYGFYGVIWLFDNVDSSGIAPCPFGLPFACCK